MGPQLPEKLQKLSPKQFRKKLNELIDYAEAIHIEDLQFEQDENEVQETASGLLIKLKR